MVGATHVCDSLTATCVARQRRAASVASQQRAASVASQQYPGCASGRCISREGATVSEAQRLQPLTTKGFDQKQADVIRNKRL